MLKHTVAFALACLFLRQKKLRRLEAEVNSFALILSGRRERVMVEGEWGSDAAVQREAMEVTAPTWEFELLTELVFFHC